MDSTPPRPDEKVLSTLNTDGSRVRLAPKPVKGAFYRKRRAVAYGLMALFIALPVIHVGGVPLVLLDLPRRQFTFFGKMFLATDTVLLMSLMVTLVVMVFLLTALFGRVWCGWACPQTVYMEFIFRPLERLLEGKAYGKKKRQPTLARRAAKQVIFLALSLFLAHIFLGYFVGLKELFGWLTESPLDHRFSFTVMLCTAALIYFDFGYFREQTCIVACPYGRIQAVLQDKRSLIVGYDEVRGEPRGARKKSMSDEQKAALGHCVNCRLCTRVCPMGIDIRNGFQLECIACTSCADACDSMMDRVGLDRGLVSYTNKAKQEGEEAKLVRPRVIIYPLIILLSLGAFGFTLARKGSADVTILRALTSPFSVLDSGEVSNPLRVKVQNRGRSSRSYRIDLEGAPEGARMISPMNPLKVAGSQARTAPVFIILPADAFTGSGEVPIKIKVSDGAGFEQALTYRLLGPATAGSGQ